MSQQIDRTNAHLVLIERVRPRVAELLKVDLVCGMSAPRQHQTTTEHYLAKRPKKILGLFQSHPDEKIFAAYPWDPSAESVPCYLFTDTMGLLRAVKDTLREFHNETAIKIVMSFVATGHTEITFVFPQRPISLPPPPEELQRQERERRSARTVPEVILPPRRR